MLNYAVIEVLHMQHLIHLFKKHWGAVVILSLMGAVAGLWFSLQQTPRYASNTRVLITQKSVSSTDAYTTLRAAERMGQSLASVMTTASFLDKVLQSGYSVRNVFPQDEALRRDIWEGMLEVSVIPDTSILDINVLHTDREQAERIVTAVSSVLIVHGKEYLGIDNLNIQVVDAPLTSVTPVKPHVPVNVAMGLLIGFILSTGVTLLRELFSSGVRVPSPAHATPVPVPPPPTPSPRAIVAPVLTRSGAHETVTAVPANASDLPSLAMPFGDAAPAQKKPVAAENTPPRVATFEASPKEPPLAIKTMHDHAKMPFGGKYFFQHKLIQLKELRTN